MINWIDLLITALLLGGLSFGLTGLVRSLAIRFSILDIPNYRSSHAGNIPRAGGVSFVILGSLVIGYFGIVGTFSERTVLIIGIPTLLLSIVGFLDDIFSLPNRIRLLAQLLIFGFVTYSLNTEIIEMYNLTSNISAWFTLLIVCLCLVWLINLFNFMDGTDGIASIEVICTFSSMALLFYMDGNEQWTMLMLLQISILLGFLIWNWPPAKIFMGDGGSFYLGSLLGISGILSSTQSNVPLGCWLVLLAAFIGDATYTLIVRIVSGQKWYRPHRSHLYQNLARTTGSHKIVSLYLMSFNLIWLLPVSLYLYQNPEQVFLCLLVAYIPIVFLAFSQKAGLPNN